MKNNVWRVAARVMVAVMVAWGAAMNAHADADAYEWPEKVLTHEDMQPLKPLRIQIKGVVTVGKIRGPAVVQAHVDPQGNVRKVILAESTGNADIDESVLQATRFATFKPHQVNGRAVDVTLLMLVKVPKRHGRSW